MDLLTPSDFHDLLTLRSDPCVSIYLPTHRAGAEAAQDRLRLKNLLDATERDLVSRGVRPVEGRDMLAPARALLTDSTFWSHQEDGLAVFLTGDGMRAFRLPVEFSELSVVSRRLHLKQLAPVTGPDVSFHVLALSQNQVRLLHATRFAVSEVELSDVPRSLAEALWYEDRERQLQFHQPGAGRGRLAAVFHGHGIGDDSADEDIVRFFRAVDDGILQIVDQHLPIVLAGVAYLFPLYREASRHPDILPAGIEGNMEHMSPDELHRRALPLVADRLDAERRAAEASFAGGNSPVASTLDEAVLAAHQGRVQALFLEPDGAILGSVDPSDLSVTRHSQRQPDSVDLTDEAAVHTWLKGGGVFLVDDIPGGGEVAALLRF